MPTMRCGRGSGWKARVLRQQAEYWKGELAGAPALLELPGDHARPAQQDYSGGFSPVRAGRELTRGLKELSQRHGATLYMTLLAGWAALLGRLSGQEEVVIGTPVANRGRVEIEKLIGFFVNTLALRVDVSGAQTGGGAAGAGRRSSAVGRRRIRTFRLSRWWRSLGRSGVCRTLHCSR